MKGGKLLIFWLFSVWGCLILNSCGNEDDSLFVIETETAFELPPQGPQVTDGFLIEFRFPLDDRLAANNLSREDVIIIPREARAEIINSGTWNYALRSTIRTVNDQGNPGSVIFQSDIDEPSRGGSWILFPFDHDVSDDMGDKTHSLFFEVSSISASPRLNSVNLRCTYNVIRR